MCYILAKRNERLETIKIRLNKTIAFFYGRHLTIFFLSKSNKYVGLFLEVSKLVILKGSRFARSPRVPNAKHAARNDAYTKSLRKSKVTVSPPSPTSKSTAAASVKAVRKRKKRGGEPRGAALDAELLLLLMQPPGRMLP